ncbi:hypothetical protein M153_1510004398 [Pseudoloma neurophilia]|uniref:Uncharacterized protein n=1 Tax=Pseudoloma neurophilia TaxID=146866 RepID=A0A0R0M5A0_9MICR|nr:hypothetical protein M153_1510004398 [Pseudoloma neurophilia]
MIKRSLNASELSVSKKFVSNQKRNIISSSNDFVFFEQINDFLKMESKKQRHFIYINIIKYFFIDK